MIKIKLKGDFEFYFGVPGHLILNKGTLVVELHNKVTAPNHYRKLAETALKNMLALADRLGMSPRSRYALKGFVAFREGEEDWG